jgi:outer membrane murein-binding lipoprotein Lpp
MAETEQQGSAPVAGNQQVQLGIGTLIIIALIVSMCSGRSETQKVQKDTAELKQQVGEINRKLDALVSKDAAAPADAGARPAQNP